MREFSSGRRWLGVAAISLLSACHTDLLTVQQPPALVTPESLQNLTGLQSIANAARRYIGYTFMYWDPSFYDGIFTDELYASYSYELQPDRRTAAGEVAYHFAWAYASGGSRVNAWVAIEFVDKFLPAFKDLKGEMYAYRAMMENFYGEDMCPGLTFNELIDGQRVYGPPMTRDDYFAYAMKDADSAKKFTNPDSTFVKNLTAMVRGYILLNQGKYAEAAAEVAGVPTSFQFSVVGDNDENNYYQWNWDAMYMQYDKYYASANSGALMIMADKEGTNGLDFISSHDARINPYPGITKGYGYGNLKQQGYIPKTWFDSGRAASKIVYRGEEARLIEAEALLAADHNDASGAFLKKLNDLRAGGGRDMAGALVHMPALANPGSYDARVNLLYREHAFWTYLESKRLGSMRRLINQYGRNAETVYPTGTYNNPFIAVTDIYDHATNLTGYSYYDGINPNIHGCTSRTN